MVATSTMWRSPCFWNRRLITELVSLSEGATVSRAILSEESRYSMNTLWRKSGLHTASDQCTGELNGLNKETLP